MDIDDQDTNQEVAILLQLYQGHVQSISLNELKRQQASQVYLALISALIAASANLATIATSAAAAMVLIISVIWYFTIRYHRALASAKFKVVEELEAKFIYKPFAREWEFFCKSDGKPRRLRLELTHIEMLAPVLLGFAAATTLVWRNWELITKLI